jgi:hypothetical protein
MQSRLQSKRNFLYVSMYFMLQGLELMLQALVQLLQGLVHMFQALQHKIPQREKNKSATPAGKPHRGGDCIL